MLNAIIGAELALIRTGFYISACSGSLLTNFGVYKVIALTKVLALTSSVTGCKRSVAPVAGHFTCNNPCCLVLKTLFQKAAVLLPPQTFEISGDCVGVSDWAEVGRVKLCESCK